ncbi:MAG: FAD-dependent oxidoreductase [Thermodesulfobacteriota bacterium]
MAKKRHVIIGNGAAGISAAEALRAEDPQASITVVSDEPHAAYSKVLLHYYIDSQIPEKGLFIRSDQFYRELRIETVLGAKVEAIRPDEQRISLDDGTQIAFDTLLIATGSLPHVPPVDGLESAGVSTMWTLADARGIRRVLKNSRAGIVIGGSFVGMQALDTLARRGVRVSVVDVAERIMPNILDRQGSEVLRSFLADRGVAFFLGVQSDRIRVSDGRKKKLALTDGREISADICILAAGARPNIGFAANTPLRINRGVVVDEYLQSNYPNIFAAGDVAEVFDRLSGERRVFGLWSTAVAQGAIAGMNMAGKKVAYPGGIDINTTAVLGLPVMTIGRTNADESAENITVKIFQDPGKRIYRKFILKDEKMVGAILMGHVDDGGLIGSLIRSEAACDPLQSRYSMGSFRHRLNYVIR